MSHTSYPRVASLKTAAAFRAHLSRSGIELPFDEAVDPAGPLAQPLEHGGVRVGNRFCILPMEGWDGTSDGKPTDLTRRRWKNFGISGAKLMWGGEAVAVRHDGRANPNQLMLNPSTQGSIAELRNDLIEPLPLRFVGLPIGFSTVIANLAIAVGFWERYGATAFVAGLVWLLVIASIQFVLLVMPKEGVAQL